MSDPSDRPPEHWDFFISYTAADRAWAEWIAWELEEVGYRVLFQAWDFVPGSHWTTRMREGIAGAERTLAILSSAYLESVYGQAEWEAAYRADPRGFTRKLIPIRVEECRRPDLLDGVVSFDLFDCDEESAPLRLREKINEALAGRAKPETAPAFPGTAKTSFRSIEKQPPEPFPLPGPPAFPGADGPVESGRPVGSGQRQVTVTRHPEPHAPRQREDEDEDEDEDLFTPSAPRTSTRERQRAAARARLEREMAARAAKGAEKWRRVLVLFTGSVTVLVVVVSTVWIVPNWPLGDGTPEESPGAATCVWIAASPTTDTTVDVGTPPTNAVNTGKNVMTVRTNFGVIEVTIDLTKVPCAAASMRHLAAAGYFDGTKCHRMFPGMLQCGDPSARGAGYRETDGTGGPTYRFANENLPTGQQPAYPAGTVAIANAGGSNTNGSQFFFVYEDLRLDPGYPVLGRITKGLDVVREATKHGHDGAYDPEPGGGHPKKDITIESLTTSSTA